MEDTRKKQLRNLMKKAKYYAFSFDNHVRV